jgi:hypothetical protein
VTGSRLRAAAAGVLTLALALVLSMTTWREQPRASATQAAGGTLRLSAEVAEPGATIKARGRVVPRVKRRVVLQRKAGGSWKRVAAGMSSRRGRYKLLAQLPKAESTLARYRVRLPRWKVRDRVLPRRVTPTDTVRTTTADPTAAPSPTATPTAAPTATPTAAPTTSPTTAPTPPPPALPGLPAGQVAVASWTMDEPGGSTTMVDGSGRGHHGAISPDAAAAGLVLHGSHYTWSSRCRDCPPVALPRLVQVPDSVDLDIPDPAVRWAVELRFSTTESHGNILQKGHVDTHGGEIKVENASELRCVFRGANGTSVVATGDRRLDDGAWHTVACVHTASSVSQWVDGVLVAQTSGRTGPIDNAEPLVIGGKWRCDQVSVGCDYYSGAVDWARVVHG